MTTVAPTAKPWAVGVVTVTTFAARETLVIVTDGIALQCWPPPQNWLQPPQFVGSVSVLTQLLSQTSGVAGGHEPHAPPAQAAPVGQSTQPAPQKSGSVLMFVHTP